MVIFYLTYAVLLSASFLWCKKIFAERNIFEKIVFWLLYIVFALAMFLILSAFFAKHGWITI